MSEYEKVSILYLAHIAGLLDVLAREKQPIEVQDMRHELQRDLRKCSTPETLRLLGASN